MTFTENGRKLVAGMIAEHEGAEALLFDTEEADDGLSLSMHIVDIQEGDRVLDFDGLKVVCTVELEEMLGDVVFDEIDGELMVGPIGGGCGCGGHEEGEGCGCGSSEGGCGGHEGGCGCQH